MNKDYESRIETTEAERIAVAAAKLAANDALNELMGALGVNRANFESVEKFKKDIALLRDLSARPSFLADIEFLNSVRSGSIKAGTRFAMALVTIFAGAFAYGMWSWVKSVFPHQ